jgi:hypothetical protein
LLDGLPGVTAWQGPEPQGIHQCYALDTTDLNLAAPSVARAVADAGWPLYGLRPEGRDLETLFREVNLDATGPAGYGPQVQEAAHV